MHVKSANQKQKKKPNQAKQHSIASIYLGCRLKAVGALYSFYTHVTPLPKFQPHLCSRGSFMNWGIFIVLAAKCVCVDSLLLST